MNKVFLTGGSGFVGSHIFKRLRDPDVYLFTRGDDPLNLVAFDPDVVIHVAGEVYDEDKMFDSNVKLTYELLRGARVLDNLTAFIYIGSSSEYGRKDHPMKEDDLLEPTTIYEATKGAGSLLVQAFAWEFGIPAMVARPFSLYGKNEADFRFIPKAIKHARAGWDFELAPGVHDWIYVEDFIDGIMMLVNKPQPGEIFNFGTGVQTTNEEVLDLIEELVGRKTKRVITDKIRSYDTDMWVADISKAKKLGWKPKHQLADGLLEIIKEVNELARKSNPFNK